VAFVIKKLFFGNISVSVLTYDTWSGRYALRKPPAAWFCLSKI